MADYISREAAVECAKHAYAKGLEPTQYIDQIPTADVEPVRHGRWVDIWGSYTCSECEYMWEDLGYKTPFCPECGCKMDLEGENASDRF